MSRAAPRPPFALMPTPGPAHPSRSSQPPPTARFSLADGYRLKEFPDDPVKVATPEKVEESGNPIMQWFNALDNPLNDGSGWFNPLNRN